MKKIRIYYHGVDMDGRLSAAIVAHHHYYEVIRDNAMVISYEDYLKNQIDFVSHAYHGELDLSDAHKFDLVYMVDLCIKPFENMVYLNDVCNGNFIWIDHHFSAIKEYNDWSKHSGLYIEGIRGDESNSKAACELCWEYLHEDTPSMAIRYISRFDVWKHNEDPNILALYRASDLELADMHAKDWPAFIMGDDDLLRRYIKNGNLLAKYISHTEQENAKAAAFTVEFAGHPTIAINTSNKGSFQFKNVYDPAIHKLQLIFSWAKGAWKFSIYTTHDDVDCSAIAQKFGGGGHKKASGFACKTLPFELPTTIEENL